MCKSNTDLTDLRGFYLARFFIRVIRVNPRKSAKSVFNSLFVGDGFIRPEVRTFVNLGRVTSIKQAVRYCLSGFLRQHRTPTRAERGNLGTDKSVPYKEPAFVCLSWEYHLEALTENG
ncbi:MAG: hypothetical protein FWG87_06440 [Defluviitaleaceae bacterium]|nr:hypothetical protein [Defluviitaleaceae bacterium]